MTLRCNDDQSRPYVRTAFVSRLSCFASINASASFAATAISESSAALATA